MKIVFTTVSKKKEAGDLALKIVEEKLAACVQILPQMTAVHYWEGKISKGKEYLLLIKTVSSKYTKLEKFISENHSYDVPEIIAVDADKVSKKYLDWAKNYQKP